ncbi:hypothetical protein A3E86_05225 [Candidatus Daviesbacteria bacterium RIFCSPHIGHO2_12_FULL_47_45]|nr:MAG: hypothetical protein A3E86_05225 [Candidatus Daviesbacteria bacterium RIFCSPHIGHO2_12_FULL_47_45]
MLAILLATGLIWLKSSYGKFASGNFVQNLGGTLEKFASKNPYPWEKSFLNQVALPNASFLGTLVLWGEAFAALALTLVSLSLLLKVKTPDFARIILVLGLLVGVILNLIFFLAAGWTSPSTESVNLIMLAIQAIAVVSILRQKA